MSGTSNFPVQIAPAGHIENVARAELEHSVNKQQLLQQGIVGTLNKENEQVQGNLPQTAGKKINNDESSGSGKQGGKRKKKKKPAEEQQVETTASSEGVWTGNILDIKV